MQNQQVAILSNVSNKAKLVALAAKGSMSAEATLHTVCNGNKFEGFKEFLPADKKLVSFCRKLKREFLGTLSVNEHVAGLSKEGFDTIRKSETRTMVNGDLVQTVQLVKKVGKKAVDMVSMFSKMDATEREAFILALSTAPAAQR